MFGFRRLFPQSGPQRIGAADGASALLEMMDLNLLLVEAGASAFAAGRPEGRLAQSRIHRELARRSGDAVSLRRAASSAELAAQDSDAKIQALGRLEQAFCAMDGAELYGDEGLLAAADKVLAELSTARGLVGGLAAAKRAKIAAGQALDRRAPLDALAALTGHDPAIAVLNACRDPEAGLALSECRIDRAELTLACARALNDDRLAARAAADLAEVIATLDNAYQPLTWARAVRIRADALRLVGQAGADVAALAEAIESLSRLFDVLLRDHSPLEWARAQASHGEVLWALAETAGTQEAWPRASGALDRAWGVLRAVPEVALRAITGARRGELAVRIAELRDDRLEFDATEAAFRCELMAAAPEKDPIGWALCQLNLGRLYLARQRCGLAPQEVRAKAGVALGAARDVFEEHGLHAIALAASFEELSARER